MCGRRNCSVKCFFFNWNKILAFFRLRPWIIIFVLLFFIAGLGFYIRMQQLPFLFDPTLGEYVPLDPDAIGIFRYVQYVVDNGNLMSVDFMRYYPTGYAHLEEFSLLVHFIAAFYTFLHFFYPSVSVGYADVVYPAYAFVLALFFFFLLVQKIFDWKVALLASLFLAVSPLYLARTLVGVSDKEAMAMVFFFLTLYLFLCFILEKRVLRSFFFVVLTSISAGILWLLWGGFVFAFFKKELLNISPIDFNAIKKCCDATYEHLKEDAPRTWV